MKAHQTPQPPKTESPADLVLCLVSTTMTQGRRSNDFSWTEEGEAVYLPGMICTGATPDDKCGCARSFAGVKTAKATTTARIDSRQRGILISNRAAYYIENWNMGLEQARNWAISDVQNMAVYLRAFKPGAVIEKRGYRLQEREGALQ